MRPFVLVALLALGWAAPAARAEDEAAAGFASWDSATFARAKKERRILVVTVSASWCHWCHVMHRETYGDPRVRRILDRAFLPVMVDADARPDLSERFRNYRWPATAFLTPDAEPVLALRGYRSPEEFLAVLGDVEGRVRRGGPYPGFDTPSEGSGAATSPDRARLLELRGRLVAQLDRYYDGAQAGWGTGQKYPVPEPVEFGLRRGRVDPKDRAALKPSLDTLAASEALLDPVWGGMFQYSVGGTWGSPHFEKIMPVNAGALATYADAYALTRDLRWLEDARTVWRWFTGFLTSPEGGFFTSQDADVNGRESGGFYRLGDAERRRIGIPRVDRHVYARENGLAIEAVLRLYAATGDETLLRAAVRAAEGILAGHKAPGGGLSHGVGGGGMLYLADQAEFGRALVALALWTGERRWVTEALEVAEALKMRFTSPRGGFFDTTPDPEAAGVFAEPLVSLEPNAAAARFLLPLSVLAERSDLRKAALSAIGAVSAPGVVDEHWRHVGGLLLAVEDALATWARVEVVGPRGDGRTRALFEEARAIVRTRPDVVLVTTDPTEEAGKASSSVTPHVLVCGPDYCSDPIAEPLGIRAAVRKVVGG